MTFLPKRALELKFTGRRHMERQLKVEPDNGRRQEEEKELVKRRKGKTVGRKKRLKTFRPTVHAKRGHKEKKNQYFKRQSE
jgi:hypothetical protein